MEPATVSKTVFKHVKGAIPPELLKKLEENPDEEYEVILLPMREAEENQDEDMPPEKKIRPEFIEKVKQSEEDVKAGRCSEAETPKELEASLKNIWNE